MQLLNISELKPHLQNSYFFDDITGDSWSEFLESIRTSGVIEPVIITQDKVIVSGHQRVRACKELGIEEVMTEMQCYDNEDQLLKDLIETNIRQRGIGNPNPVKFGRCIKELERIYGIHQGNGSNQYEQKPQNADIATNTQEDLASQLGISVDTLSRYKQLADIIPEVEDFLDTGMITQTTALAITRQLSQEDQKQLMKQLDKDTKYTKSEVQKYIDEIKQLKENPPLPEDYEEVKKKAKEYEQDYLTLETSFKQKVAELQETRKKLEAMEDSTPESEFNKKLKDSTLVFCSRAAEFVEKVGGYVWLTDHINELPNLERQGYIKAINAVKSCIDTMSYNINNKIKEIM